MRKVEVSWDSENVCVHFSFLKFLFYFLGYICGGLNNCKGYHIVLLFLNVKQGCGKDMPPKRHNSNFSFFFCVFLPGPFVWYGYQPFLQCYISFSLFLFFFFFSIAHSLTHCGVISKISHHMENQLGGCHITKGSHLEGMLLRAPGKVKRW